MVQQKTAERLARLERQSLNQLQQELAKIDTELAKLNSAKRTAKHELSNVMSLRGLDLPLDIANTLSQGLQQRCDALEPQINEVTQAQLAANESLRAQLLEVKRWEMIGERAGRRELNRQQQQEQKALDEAATLSWQRI